MSPVVTELSIILYTGFQSVCFQEVGKETTGRSIYNCVAHCSLLQAPRASDLMGAFQGSF